MLCGYAAQEVGCLLDQVREITAASPFRRMSVRGRPMSVGMTNCGAVGWVTGPTGYRYDPVDPDTGRPWPPMPASFLSLAGRAAAEAGFPRFAPDACLVNEYLPGSRLSLHRDADERDFAEPIVSVSLGLPATFLFGGLERGETLRRLRLGSGDVVVWGGRARLAFHGVEPIAGGVDPLAGPRRINLTFRRAM